MIWNYRISGFLDSSPALAVVHFGVALVVLWLLLATASQRSTELQCAGVGRRSNVATAGALFSLHLGSALRLARKQANQRAGGPGAGEAKGERAHERNSVQTSYQIRERIIR